MNYGDMLREARVRANHTQESLAAAIREVFPGAKRLPTRPGISKLEKGRSGRPRDLTWARLRAVLPKLPELRGKG